MVSEIRNGSQASAQQNFHLAVALCEQYKTMSDSDEDMREDTSLVKRFASLVERYLAATGRGDIATVKAILEDETNKIHVDSVDRAGYSRRTALMIAIKNEKKEIARYLIQKGANVNREDEYSITPLALTAEWECRFLLLKEVVQAGADVNYVPGGTGMTAFLTACKNHNLAGMKYLAHEAKADTTRIAEHGMTPLHIFLHSSAQNHDFRDYDLWRSMVPLNSEPCLQALLDIAGSDMINAKNEKGLTPLFYAAMTNSVAYTELLIKHGADVNIRDDRGLQIIHYVTKGEIIRLLAKSGADLSLRNNCLRRAVEKVQHEKISVLLELGENIDESTGRELVEVLIEKYFGTSRFSRHEYYETLHLLKDHGAPIEGYSNRQEDIECMLACNPHPSDVIGFFEAVQMDEVKTVQRYLKDRERYDILVDVRDLGWKRKTALHVAARRSFFVLQYLLQNESPSLELKTKSGYTALHLACKHGNLRQIRCLVEAGADTEAKTNKGATPLLLACGRRHYHVIEYLFQNGVNTSAENGNNWLFSLLFKKFIDQELGLGDDFENGSNDEYDNSSNEDVNDDAGNESDEENGSNDESDNSSNEDGNDDSGNESDEESDVNLDTELKAFLASNLPRYGKDIINEPVKSEDYTEMALTEDGIINVPVSVEESALHWACRYYRYVDKEIVQFLIENGADVNSKRAQFYKLGARSTGNTPLHFCEHFNLAESLVKEYGADVNAQNDAGNTPLHQYLLRTRANGTLNKAYVEMLCSLGANTNIQSESGETVLHIGVEEVIPHDITHDCVSTMLRAGSRLTIQRNGDLATPVHLLFSTSSCRSGTTAAILQRRRQRIDSLLDHCLSSQSSVMSSRDSKGNTPLMWFLRSTKFAYSDDEHEKIIAMDENEWITNIFVAKKEIHLRLAQLLSLTGANIHLQNHDNQTPLIFAATNYSQVPDPELGLGIIFDLLKHHVGISGNVDGHDSGSRGVARPKGSKKRQLGACTMGHHVTTVLALVACTLTLLVTPAASLLSTRLSLHHNVCHGQVPLWSSKSPSESLFLDDMSSMFQTRMAPIPDMPSQLFQELASSQLEFLANSLTSKQRPGSSKVKSMALYLPQENVVTGQLEFTPVVLYPRRDRVFIAPDADSGVAPTLPPTLTKLPGFSHAKSLIPGYPMVSSGTETSGTSLKEDGSIGMVEEVLCDLQSNGACALSVPLFSGIQTVGVLLVSPADVPVGDPFESVWTTEDRQQVARAARSLSLALNMEQQNQAVAAEKKQIAEALSDSMHQVKNPLQALRTYGKMLQQQIAQNDFDHYQSDAPSYLRSSTSSHRRLLELAGHLMVQSDRLSKRLEPVDSMVELLSSQSERPALLPAGSSALVAMGDTNNSEPESSSSLIPISSLLAPWENIADSEERNMVAKDRTNEPSSQGSLSHEETHMEQNALPLKESSPQSSLKLSTPHANGNLEMAFVPDVLESTLDAFATIAQDRGIDFSLFQDLDELPGVTINPVSLDEVVGNVLDNALKYVIFGKDENPSTNPMPRVLVYILPNDDEVDDPGVTIVVSDNGPGIPAGDEEAIFSRGYRVDATQERAPGQGLGLPIARSLMETMGGKIRMFEKFPKRNDQVSKALKNKLLDGATMEIVVYRKRS